MVEVKDMRQLFELALKIETAVAGGAAANAGPWDQMRALTGPWAVFGPRTCCAPAVSSPSIRSGGRTRGRPALSSSRCSSCA